MILSKQAKYFYSFVGFLLIMQFYEAVGLIMLSLSLKLHGEKFRGLLLRYDIELKFHSVASSSL